MAETDQERTEEATPKRRDEAKKKGQLPRSKELNTVSILVAAAVSFFLLGEGMGQALQKVMKTLFSLKREEVFDFSALIILIESALWMLMPYVALFLAIMFIAGFVGSIIVGGMNFSVEAMMPKASKLSPLNGFKRMFGTQAAVELTKAIAKVLVVAGVATLMLKTLFPEILALSKESMPLGIFHGLDLFLWMFIALCFSLILIVTIDIPYQIWNHNKQLKMTKQEVKDEFKQTEGNPEIKRAIRRAQTQASQRKMMAEVPTADVVVTNPTHYSVALRYDAAHGAAPVVVAKGSDHVAMKIREIAGEYDVPIMRQPALTRAIYYTTELEHPIPHQLFTAVAQVLAYIYQLKQFNKGVGRRPTPLPEELEIPEELRH